MRRRLRQHRAITQAWKITARKSTGAVSEQYPFPNTFNFSDIHRSRGPKPSLAHYMSVSCRTSLGLCWRPTLAAHRAGQGECAILGRALQCALGIAIHPKVGASGLLRPREMICEGLLSPFSWEVLCNRWSLLLSGKEGGGSKFPLPIGLSCAPEEHSQAF